MKRRITHRTQTYREQKFPCSERERLEKAYQVAIHNKHALEDDLDREWFLWSAAGLDAPRISAKKR